MRLARPRALARARARLASGRADPFYHSRVVRRGRQASKSRGYPKKSTKMEGGAQPSLKHKILPISFNGHTLDAEFEFSLYETLYFLALKIVLSCLCSEIILLLKWLGTFLCELQQPGQLWPSKWQDTNAIGALQK
jgi:hypothetical protein